MYKIWHGFHVTNRGVLKQVSGNKDYVGQTNLSPQLIDVAHDNIVPGYLDYWTVLNIGAYELI